MSASNPAAARLKLRREDGLFITKLDELAETSQSIEVNPFARSHEKKQVAAFFKQMAVLLQAGVPLLEALEEVTKLSEHKKFQWLLIEVREKIAAGAALWEALSQHPRFFSQVHVQITRAGEASGALSRVMKQLAQLEKKQTALLARVRAASYYPGFLTVTGVAVVIFLMSYIVPTLTDLFTSMGQKLPFVTRLLIWISHGITQWWWLALLLLLGLGLLLQRSLKTESGQLRFDQFKLRLPVLGDLLKQVILFRITATLATLLQSGVELLQALEIVSKSTGNLVFERILVRARTGVSEGKPLAKLLATAKVFPAMVTKMLAVGEATDGLAEICTYLAEVYSEEVDNSITRLSSLIEPAMVVGMSLVVGFIAAAVLLPIFELNLMVH